MKRDLRIRLLSLRAALSPEARRLQSRAVVERLRELPPLRTARSMLGYAALPEELDVGPFLQESSSRGILVALPRVEKDRLVAHAWRPGDPLRPGAFRVPEPAPEAPVVEPQRIHVVVVPGVGFDRTGNRLGFGRGYFDRFLAGFPHMIRVGVAFDEQLVDEIPLTESDVPMDWVVTADGTHRHGRERP